LRVLSLGRRRLRLFARPAANQERVLQGFQDAGWLTRIPNPFLTGLAVDPCKLLRQTLRNLNRNLRGIGFSCEEKGKFVSWHRR
jgi:hypothetical protein